MGDLNTIQDPMLDRSTHAANNNTHKKDTLSNWLRDNSRTPNNNDIGKVLEKKFTISCTQHFDYDQYAFIAPDP